MACAGLPGPRPPAARPAGPCFPGPSAGAAFAAWRRDIAIQHGVSTAAHGDGGATTAGAHQCRHPGRDVHAEVSTCGSAVLTPPSEASSQLGALALQQGFAFDPRVASNVCIFHFFFFLSFLRFSDVFFLCTSRAASVPVILSPLALTRPHSPSLAPPGGKALQRLSQAGRQHFAEGYAAGLSCDLHVCLGFVSMT